MSTGANISAYVIVVGGIAGASHNFALGQYYNFQKYSVKCFQRVSIIVTQAKFGLTNVTCY